MNKLKEPVIYRFEQTSFEVDIDKQLLRQTDNPGNEISFINQMSDLGDHYLLAWDARIKNAGSEPEYTEPIIVPPMIELDPQGMAEKYGLTVEQLKGKTDFGVIVDPYALEARRAGILPTIDIAGERFIVDLRLQELRHAQHFFPVISLRSFELTNDGWHYEAFYEPVMKQVVNLDLKLTGFPDHIIKIKIPNEIGLDPVETARRYGMNERELLRRYPIQENLKAEIIPLSETEVPRLIRQNREQLRREHAENMRKAKPRLRPKF